MQAPVAAIAAATTNPLDIIMAAVNSNPYFIGLMMLLLNLGGRFLSLEISKDQEKILKNQQQYQLRVVIHSLLIL
jgi:adenosine/AMP kinase